LKQRPITKFIADLRGTLSLYHNAAVFLENLMRRLMPWKKSARVPMYVTEGDREGLRAAGRFNASLLDHLREHIVPGVSTDELDQLAMAYTRGHGNIPACLGYQGFPKSICTSVNQVVCHGIPGKYVLRDGDIINVDCTSIVDGWYGDCSETFLVGDVSEDACRIAQAAFDALWLAIRSIEPYSRVSEIGNVIGRFAHDRQLGVVENFQGHGIGRRFHQDPGIPHHPVRSAKKDVLYPGTSFTIEPMLNLGDKETLGPLTDGWTVMTQDSSLSAQFEHQILMTEKGPEVLTQGEFGPREGHVFQRLAADRESQQAERFAVAGSGV